MNDQSTNPLAVANRLGQLTARLEHMISQTQWVDYGYYGRDTVPLAAGLLTVLRELIDGAQPIDAVSAALDAYDEQTRLVGEYLARREQSRRDAYDQLMTEESLTRTVECPHCGAAPDTKCRSTGPTRQVHTESHKARQRLARSLNDPPKTERR